MSTGLTVTQLFVMMGDCVDVACDRRGSTDDGPHKSEALIMTYELESGDGCAFPDSHVGCKGKAR